MATERVDLPIAGMTCASCATRVEKNLNNLDGVEATVNYATERASVEYDVGAVEPERLLDAVEAAGYTATLTAAEGIPESEPGEDDETADRRQGHRFNRGEAQGRLPQGLHRHADDGGDVTIHGIEALEHDQLRPLGLDPL